LQLAPKESREEKKKQKRRRYIEAKKRKRRRKVGGEKSGGAKEAEGKTEIRNLNLEVRQNRTNFLKGSNWTS